MFQPENLEEILSKFEGTSREVLTHYCVICVGN